MHAAPLTDAVPVSSLLHGETFTVFDTSNGWAWGQCSSDGYVGWVTESALHLGALNATHRVTAPDALLFSAPSIKSTVLARLPLNASVVAEAFDDSFVYLPTERGWLHRRHIAPLVGDAVDLAHGFIGTPYRWGGRSRAGIDCSGLTQAVLLAHGIACPRDSDQQLAAFAPADSALRQRGDLAFFPGHVGMMVDAEHVVHANAYWMTTLIEPLATVLERLRNDHVHPLIGIARPPLSAGGALGIGPLGEPERRSECATAATA